MIVDLALAFLVGLLSFASTCVLPLVPAYVAYMGASSSETTTTLRQQLKVLGNAALLVGGFATAFLLRAGSSGTAAQGALLLAVYSAGLGLPFLIAAGVSGMLSRLLARVRGAYAVLNAVAAVFLIGMGLLIFSNRLTVFNDFFPV